MPQTSFCRQDGRVSRGTLGDPQLKVAFYDNGQVRVTSQYDLGAAFVFQPAPRDAATKHGGTRNSRAARMQLLAQGEGGPQELL